MDISSTALIKDYMAQFEDIQNHQLWMGQNFVKKLAGISSEDAFVIPNPKLHSIAQLIVHLTIWRQETVEKLKTGKGNMTDDMEDNWPSNEALNQIGWKILWHTITPKAVNQLLIS